MRIGIGRMEVNTQSNTYIIQSPSTPDECHIMRCWFWPGVSELMQNFHIKVSTSSAWIQIPARTP